MSEMNTLALVGVGCVLAAVVGGGFKGLGIEIPVLKTLRRQVLLACAGIGLIGWTYVQPYVNRESINPAAIVSEALSLYDAGDHFGALEKFRVAAKNGNPEAEFHLGEMLQHGEGVAANYAEGRKWIVRSAEKGFPLAQTSLALGILQESKGAEKREAKALASRAAAQGDPDAQLLLYFLEDDARRKLEHLRAAAEAGIPAAEREMGIVTLNSVPAEKYSQSVYLDALSWWRRAIEKHDPLAHCLWVQGSRIWNAGSFARWSTEQKISCLAFSKYCLENRAQFESRAVAVIKDVEKVRADLEASLSVDDIQSAVARAQSWSEVEVEAQFKRHTHVDYRLRAALHASTPAYGDD